jgi:hypothetical protein
MHKLNKVSKKNYRLMDESEKAQRDFSSFLLGQGNVGL